MATRPRLAIDLGELADEPEELYQAADVASIACGGHAGDEASMRRALVLCRRHRASAGAHPSYPDREGFGRRRLGLDAAAVERAVREQCAALARLARAAGTVLVSVKPHGALYHDADADADLAAAVVHGARAALDRVAVIGPANGALAAAAAAAGLPFWREGFADRARRPGADGRFRLLPRDQPGALIDDPAAAAAQARLLVAEGGCEVICVHGDGANAVAVAHAVAAALREARQP